MARIDTTTAAAQAVAEKVARGNKKNGSANVNDSAFSPVSTTSATSINKNVPGLITLTPELLPAQMPAFHPEKYHIADPLNPPETLPQATQAQFDKGMKVYQGATRALKLTGAALDLTRERFTVVGKHAKALGSGIQAATEIEKVKGNFLDYLNQKEVTSQKEVTLEVNQTKTNTDTSIAIHSKSELDEKLKQAKFKAEELRLKTLEIEGKLTSFREQLGDYIEVEARK